MPKLTPDETTRLTAARAEPTHDDFETLFVNNEKLDRISAWLNRFNPIRTMKMEGMEIRHSAILSWLLDPKETHGFGDRFLKAFLGEALRGQSAAGHPTAIEVSQSDLRDAEVRSEWQNIDIFILSRRNRWAFVVENKFYSSQSEGQLAKYVQRVRSVFEPQGERLSVRGVFLTLLDEEPQDANYAPVRYQAICEFLPRLMAHEGHAFSQEVAIFIRHYLEIIEEATGMSKERTEIEKLARQLYLSHRKVIDFVIEHGGVTEFVVAAESLFGEGLDYGHVSTVEERGYMYGFHNNHQYSFLPVSWVDAFGGMKYEWPGCENWWAGYPLICWFQLIEGDGSGGQLRLFAEVGPISDPGFRRDLIEAIRAAAERRGLKNIRFQQGASNAGKRFSKFIKDNSVDVQDIRDADELAKAMKLLLSKFGPSFDAIAEILPPFLRYGEEETDK